MFMMGSNLQTLKISFEILSVTTWFTVNSENLNCVIVSMWVLSLI